MRRIVTAIAAIALAVLAASAATAAESGVCLETDDSVKVETGDMNDIVVTADVVLCVKGGQENTGTIVADGETTLKGYLAAAGISVDNGNTPDVSHYVVYDEPTPIEDEDERAPEPEPEDDTEDVAEVGDVSMDSPIPVEPDEGIGDGAGPPPVVGGEELAYTGAGVIALSLVGLGALGGGIALLRRRP